MQVFTLNVVNWQSVKVDESNWWFEAIIALRFDDTLVDISFLVQGTLPWLVAGKHSVAMVSNRHL